MPNRIPFCGVLLDDANMYEHAGRIAGSLLSVDEQLERDFEDRLRESSRLAFRVAYSVVRHREDAEDIAQEAFTRAYRRFAQLRDRERFRSWLVRMTWRLALDHQRGSRRRVARERRADIRAELTAAETVAARERAAHLWDAIDSLPGKLRLVTVLAGIEGHDTREVATLLGLPQGTVKSRLSLARQKMREHLQWTWTGPENR